MLRGTALEYFEGALPEDMRTALWPFLEDRRPQERTAHSPDAVLQQLLLSNESIQLRLEELHHQTTLTLQTLFPYPPLRAGSWTRSVP